MRRKVFPAGNARFEVYVKITNAGNGFLSECVTSIVDIMPRPATDIYTILSPLTTLAKGEHRYVLVAGFNEVKGTNGQRVYNDLVTFAFATGGFTTLEPPTADAPAIITVELRRSNVGRSANNSNFGLVRTEGFMADAWWTNCPDVERDPGKLSGQSHS